jgi:hypothetical protein
MIANVKLEAAWGIDHIHLTKFRGEFMTPRAVSRFRCHHL